MPFQISDVDEKKDSQQDQKKYRRGTPDEDVPEMGTFDLGLNMKEKYREMVEEFSENHGRTGMTLVGSSQEGDRAFIVWDQNEYLFMLEGRKAIELPFEEVQAIMSWYTNAGQRLNMKGVCRELIKEFGRKLTLDEFRRIKQAMEVTKTSQPIAPHILAQDDVPIEDKVDFMYEQKEAEIEVKQRAKREDEWERRYRRCAKKLRDINHYISEALQRRTKRGVKYEVPDLTFDNSLRTYTPIVFLADWHVGKKTDIESNVFDRDIFDVRVQRLIKRLEQKFRACSRPMDEVHVALGGDFLDGPAGDMHPQQHLDQDIHNTEQCLIAADAISEVVNFLAELLDVPLYVHSVPGNHGRTRKDHEQDPYRIAENLTYEIAERQSAGEWDIMRDDMMNTWKIRNTGIYLQHGDDIPYDIRDIVWSSEIPDCEHYLVLTGHKHSFQVSGSSDRNVLHVRSSSLCGDSEYATRQLGKTCRPSQTIVKVFDEGPEPGGLIYLDE